eukprot:CAMPEP_0182541524 /NCGR_PEP_ID=MMETSP1323-20130603/28765_1 /TAXON_ID=236787 /ORGANISM="Florenciella parvula, Strain RCC1693" /LENGTH=181 /DNA_ID=CAMNT_0024752285 /DNA_START=51 /DNA_END=596 /DNA_ORIENTATION=+
MLRLVLLAFTIAAASANFYICESGSEQFLGHYTMDTSKTDGAPKFSNDEGMSVYRHSGYWYIGDLGAVAAGDPLQVHPGLRAWHGFAAARQSVRAKPEHWPAAGAYVAGRPLRRERRVVDSNGGGGGGGPSQSRGGLAYALHMPTTGVGSSLAEGVPPVGLRVGGNGPATPSQAGSSPGGE